MWTRAAAFLALASLAFAGSDVATADVLAGVQAALVGEWNGDGEPDLAVLHRPAPDADAATLWVFLSGAEPAVLEGAAWTGRMWGALPRLEATPDGFEVISENAAVGRDRWQEALAVAYRKGALVVVRYRYAFYDAVGGARFECAVDFERRAGVRGGERFAVAWGPVALERWTADRIPPPCKAR